MQEERQYPRKLTDSAAELEYWYCRHCQERIHPQDWDIRYCPDCDLYIHAECEDDGSCPSA